MIYSMSVVATAIQKNKTPYSVTYDLGRDHVVVRELWSMYNIPLFVYKRKYIRKVYLKLEEYLLWCKHLRKVEYLRN